MTGVSDTEWGNFIKGRDVTNDSAGALAQTHELIMGAGIGECELWWFSTTNNDTVARACTITLDDGAGGTAITILPSTSINAGISVQWPFVGTAPAATGNTPQVFAPLRLGAGARLLISWAAVALSQDTSAYFGGRWRGVFPTFTDTGKAPLVFSAAVDMRW